MKSSLVIFVFIIFYVISSPLIVSLAEVNEPLLEVTGLVERPFNITMSEFTTMQMVSERVTCTCVGYPPETPGANSYDVYTYEWSGIPVARLLERAGVKGSAIDVIFHASDGYASGLELKYALDEKNIIAIRADGGVLDSRTGYPFRLVVPGWWGYKWVKFVNKIEIVDFDFKGSWESAGYPDVAIIPNPDGGTKTEISTLYSVVLAIAGLILILVGVYRIESYR